MSEKIYVEGGNKLSGSVTLGGSKNSALVCIAAACLVTDGSEVTLKNVPDISDTFIMCDIIRQLGKTVSFENDTLRISGYFTNSIVPKELSRKIRASMYFLGLLLATTGETCCGHPGGDQIGERPIDIHLYGLKKMGAEITVKNCMINASVPEKLTGGHIYLKYPSVGATCNLMLAATRAEGRTIIDNAAKEPEIVDLSNLLLEMGVKVSGAGTDRIVVNGTNEIHGGVVHEVIWDRIEAGVIAIAVSMCGGEVMINKCIPYHNYPLISILSEIGVEVDSYEEGIFVKSKGVLEAFNVSMMPFPGVATDLQPAMTAMATKANGMSAIADYVFQDRFQYTYELINMGAKIVHMGNSLKVYGNTKLHGNCVQGTDIRAVSALICAGLIAEGTTVIDGLYHLRRGYPNLEQKLRDIGADIVIK